MINQISNYHNENVINSLNAIKTQLQSNKVELVNQEEIEKIKKIYQSANEQLALCNKNIKKIKALQQNTSTDQTYAQTLLSLKECKEEILELKKKSEERLFLIERRQALYNQEQLPAVTNFANLLDNVCMNYPLLEEDVKHFKYVVESSMGLIPVKLTPNDCEKIRSFAEKIENVPELTDLHRTLVSQYASMQDAIDRKEILLGDLATWLENEELQNVPFNDWTQEQKLYFLTRADQILHNPFETKFDTTALLQSLQAKNHPSSPQFLLYGLINTLLDENTKTSKKSDFWNHAPPFERRCHEVANTPELQDYLYACKIEGLKKIISLREPKEGGNPHLIVGAGPSGLMSALTKKMQGLEYQIVEKRGAAKVPRENTITLGKGDPKDLEILFFLGVMAECTRHNKVSLGHNKAPLMEIKIGDVENGLHQVLEELHGHDPIRYNTEVSDISVTPFEEAKVTLTNSEGAHVDIHPASVIITDGFSGKTKHLLGISRIDLAKPTMIAYSIFKNVPKEPKTSKSLKYRLSNALKGIVLMVSIAIHKIVKNTSIEESYAKVIRGGPSAIFRVPDQDYLIRVLRKKEQNILMDYRNRIGKIDLKLRKLESKPKTEQNTAKAEQLQKERDALQQIYSDRLNTHAEEVHGVLDFFQTVLNPSGHQMKQMPMNSTNNFLVDIQVGKAERNVVVVGHTPFLIRGDASHSTDPYSGYGCKTALEEMQADQHFYNQYSDLDNPVNVSILAWGHEYYQRRMINIGLKERHFYRKRTENFRRFVDCAISNGVIDQEEADKLIRLNAKRAYENNPLITITENERLFSLQIQDKLLAKLKHSLDAKRYQPNGKQKVEDLFSIDLTGKEKRLLRKVLHQTCANSIDLDAKERKSIEALCGKLTFHDIQEGWLLAMLLSLETN